MNDDQNDQSLANDGNTTDDKNQSSQPSGEAHEEITKNTNEPEDYKEKFNRLSTKISSIEQEKNQVENTYKQVSTFIYEDRNRLKEFLKNKGYSDEYAETQIADIQKNYPELASKWGNLEENKPQNNTPSFDPQNLEKNILEKAQNLVYQTQFQEKQAQASKKFISLHPEISPEKVRGLPFEEKETIKNIINQVDSIGLTMAQQTGKPLDQCYSQVYSLLTGNPPVNEEINEINNQHSANINNFGIGNLSQASVSSNKNKPQLSEIQRQVIKEANMTEEDYISYMQNP